MSGIRHAYHRYFGHHERFHLAVILTIIAVSYVAVPRVVAFITSVTGYNPTEYEPKDLERQLWLKRAVHPDQLIGSVSWETLFNVALFLLVAIVWLTVVPNRAPRRRAPRR